jgi:hypothetical protein
MVEKDRTVYGYYHRLWEAKEHAEKLGNNTLITKLLGDRFGEGWHEYYLLHQNNRYRYVRTNQPNDWGSK